MSSTYKSKPIFMWMLFPYISSIYKLFVDWHTVHPTVRVNSNIKVRWMLLSVLLYGNADVVTTFGLKNIFLFLRNKMKRSSVVHGFHKFLPFQGGGFGDGGLGGGGHNGGFSGQGGHSHGGGGHNGGGGGHGGSGHGAPNGYGGYGGAAAASSAGAGGYGGGGHKSGYGRK